MLQMTCPHHELVSPSKYSYGIAKLRIAGNWMCYMSMMMQVSWYLVTLRMRPRNQAPLMKVRPCSSLSGRISQQTVLQGGTALNRCVSGIQSWGTWKWRWWELCWMVTGQQMTSSIVRLLDAKRSNSSEVVQTSWGTAVMMVWCHIMACAAFCLPYCCLAPYNHVMLLDNCFNSGSWLWW